MSYARKGQDSDIHVFKNAADLYVCYECALYHGETFTLRSLAALETHLNDHRAAAHRVPSLAFERVETEKNGHTWTGPFPETLKTFL